MISLKQGQSFFKKDRFATDIGIQIDAIDKNYACCSMDIKENLFNAGGGVQGGAIFTLGDFAFAVASNLEGVLVVSLNNNITFLRGTRGKRLIAEANIVSQTKRTCCYDVLIKDDLGVLIASMTINGFITETPLDYKIEKE